MKNSFKRNIEISGLLIEYNNTKKEVFNYINLSKKKDYKLDSIGLGRDSDENSFNL